ncbi:armadillo-type protein, partial [Favolaschia claudopus]
SWWSDSNPGLQGPTVNLHAASKPLQKFLYHRQALNIIKKDQGKELDSETLETYASYFPWNFVASGTKAAILSKLAEKAELSENAEVLLDSSMLPQIVSFLGSPECTIRQSSCKLMGRLGRHKTSGSVILKLGLYTSLLPLLEYVRIARKYMVLTTISDEDPGVTAEALCALSKIAIRPTGAQTVLDAGAAQRASQFLQSPDSRIRRWSCQLVGRLSEHGCTAPRILELRPCQQLVLLLQEKDPEVVEGAVYALSRIALWPNGAKAVVDAEALGYISILFDLKELRVLKWCCECMGRIAHAGIIEPGVSEMRACRAMVRLLTYEDPKVNLKAAYALAQFAKWPECAQVIADTNVLDHDCRLFQVLDLETQKWSCKLVERLATHERSGPAILTANMQICEVLCCRYYRESYDWKQMQTHRLLEQRLHCKLASRNLELERRMISNSVVDSYNQSYRKALR